MVCSKKKCKGGVSGKSGESVCVGERVVVNKQVQSALAGWERHRRGHHLLVFKESCSPLLLELVKNYHLFHGIVFKVLNTLGEKMVKRINIYFVLVAAPIPITRE